MLRGRGRRVVMLVAVLTSVICLERAIFACSEVG